jgi:hypothetical protein
MAISRSHFEKVDSDEVGTNVRCAIIDFTVHDDDDLRHKRELTWCECVMCDEDKKVALLKEFCRIIRSTA